MRACECEVMGCSAMVSVNGGSTRPLAILPESRDQGWSVLADTATVPSWCEAWATTIQIPGLAPDRLPALFAGSRAGAHSSPPAGAGGENPNRS